MKKLMIIITVFFLISCVKEKSKDDLNDSKLIIRDVSVVFFDKTKDFSNFSKDSLIFLGLKLGKTTISDLGNNYYTLIVENNNDNIYSTTINFSNANNKDVDELIKYKFDKKVVDFNKKFRYKDFVLIAEMNFYKNKLVRIKIKDFPYDFINKLNLSKTLSEGYSKDYSYKVWESTSNNYERYSTNKLICKWENNDILININYISDSVIKSSNKKIDSESLLIIEDKKGFFNYKKTFNKERKVKQSTKNIELKNKINELANIRLLLEFEKDKNLRKTLVDKSIKLTDEINSIRIKDE